MALEIKIDERTAQVELLSLEENIARVKVDDKVYEVDIVMVEEMVYSMLYNGRSYNIEMIQGETQFKYYVNSLYNSYNVEIHDPASRLKLGKAKEETGGDTTNIISPMPAKIVKVLVKEGDEVKKGQTVVIVSAMKMEMEFKAKKDGKIKKINVKEEDTVGVNEVLIILE
jgi:biotin carboxyl carrier protein